MNGLSIRNDGLMNVINGLNTSRYDPSRALTIGLTRYVTPQMAVTLYTDDGLFAKIINTPADDATRNGFEIEGIDEQSEHKLESLFEDLAGEQNFSKALSFNRLTGGSVVMPVFVDGSDKLTEPLNENKLQRIEEIRVYDSTEVTPLEIEQDATNRNFGKTKTYLINDLSTGAYFEIHASRLLIFDGELVPNIVRAQRSGWGGMVLEKVFDALVDKYNKGNKYTVDIMERMAQGVMKIDGYANRLSSIDGNEHMIRYLNNIDMTRSILNTLAIDKLDDFDFKNIPLTGIKDVLDKFQTALAGVTEIPVTLLFGRSPGGQNATGDSDFEQYYSFVGKIQARQLKPNLSRFIYLLSKCRDYNITLPEYWNIKFKPLKVASEKEEAEIEYIEAQTEEKKANTMAIYQSVGALDGQEIRDEISKDYKLVTTMDYTGMPDDIEGE